MRPIALICVLACVFVGAVKIVGVAASAEGSAAGANHLADVFSSGWMLVDTNGDGIPDAISGKIVVPAGPSSAENAAAANCAVRLAFGSMGLTLPLVVRASDAAKDGPRVWIGKSAVPANVLHDLDAMTSQLEKGEGGVFAAGNDLALIANDDEGLTEAANSFCARSPYLWEVPGERFPAISEAVTSSTPGTTIVLIGVTYEHGKQGIRRAFLHASAEVQPAALTQALSSPQLASVHELVVLGGATAVSAVNPKPMAEVPAAKEPPEKANPDEEAEEQEPLELDLATLYTAKGLFKGSPKIPFPAALKAHLYVPAGPEGTALANLAARVGLEGTGITLPFASHAEEGTPKKVKTPAILASSSPLVQEAEKKLQEEEAAAGQSPASLSAGEGELRVVDNVFKKNGVVLVRGDDAGSIAALDLLAGRFPSLWNSGKQYLSLENIRYELHRFFALHSAVGQATDAVYLLDRWAKDLASAPGGSTAIRDVKAEVYVDVADPKLEEFVRKTVEKDLGVSRVQVTTGSLHAGTQCCDANPDLHYATPSYPFHQAKPTFSEDLVISWEGTRLLQAVRDAAPKIKSGQAVTLTARVSEGPEQRQKLTSELEKILADAGADRSHTHVEVLCAYKQGYSWLVDEIAPALEGKSAAAIQIDFAKNVDPTNVRAMSTPVRWVQELYPVDEVLAQKLNIPLSKITFEEFTPEPHDPTYRVRATDTGGKEILNRSFSVTSAMQPYSTVMPEYEQVQVDTGWVRLESGSDVLLDQRIKTDIEEFWDHYQNVTLPKVDKFIMSQAHGEIRPEYQPLFDTLRIDIHMSEPDYNIGIDKERISSLEALQEDTFYITVNFIDMIGHLEASHAIDYPGRILPIVHSSEDGKDGRVRIEFYGKPAANPLVRLSWTGAQGDKHERERNLPALRGPFQPRLIGARVKDGADGVESLTWSLPTDFLNDDYDAWVKVELRDRVEHTVFSAEQGSGQLHWLEQMHAAGLYSDDLAYPHLARIALRFDLPRATDADVDKPSSASYASFAISAPAHPRPMISDYAGKNTGTPIVQWKEPISPEENAEILARLATYPGITPYWMGRSYLGQNLWAADVMLPSPSVLHSWAKETTLKASAIYSGRQHANEVSSTSHIDKLGEMLATDPKIRDLLRQVNVVLHPIDNSDGAQLSVELAKITPDNLLHPGYHGSLSADVADGLKETDPIYPESRTRPLLIKSWLPDAFLNPHGYPSHEWVQPFSDYTGWVMSRQADSGREWWLPRGWFTSLEYLRDPEHPYGESVAYALRDRIVQAERNVPDLLPLEERMNARYERFGQRWDPRYMAQPIVGGIRFYMALKGSPPDPEETSMVGLSPDITWDDGYTEAPDETAHGDYMKLVASAGLAFDMVHLNYLAQGKLRIVRTQKSGPDGVEWKIDRKRPILPSSEPPVPPLPAN
ncbi:MAG: M14 family zinc carboxypeptidase [Candidatus Acidiferrales bacterium]